jgi:FKBP-type peptidyl-prolyl cis-trans isomerase SlyD
VTAVTVTHEDGALQVAPGMVVCLEYRLFDAEGALVEAPGPDEPLEFLVGSGQAPRGLERAIEGLTTGESRRVQLGPEDAFGPRDESALIRVERGELPAGAVLGDEFEAESDDGEVVFLRVVEIDADGASLDANHPLSGQVVELELLVVSVRSATAAELAEVAAQPAGSAPTVPDVLSSRLTQKRTGKRPPPR